MGKFKATVDKFLGKIDHTSERYETALEQKQEELVVLQGQLQDASIKFKEFQKMHVLGDISDGALKDASVDVGTLTEKIASLQEQIALIDHYKREDIKSELAEIDKVKNEFNKEQRKEITRIQYELQQAKLEYLQKMLKARGDYGKVVNTDVNLANLLIKLGMKQRHYVTGAYEGIGFPGHPNDTSFKVETPFVDKPLAFDVLNYGKLPSHLIKFVEEGKKAGYLGD